MIYIVIIYNLKHNLIILFDYILLCKTKEFIDNINNYKMLEMLLKCNIINHYKYSAILLRVKIRIIYVKISIYKCNLIFKIT